MMLVTGGTGFIGRATVDALLRRGHPVRVFTRNPAAARLPPEVEVVTGDLLDPASLRAAATGASVVVHLAAALPDERADPSSFSSVNESGTRNLATAARDAGASRFVYVSSAGVYGSGPRPHQEHDEPRPQTQYERSKHRGELAVSETLGRSATSWTILRPAGVHGPGRGATLAFLRSVAQRTVWLHGPTRIRVHPTHVDDAVSAVVSAATTDAADRTIVNVGGERALFYDELIDTVARLLDHRLSQYRVTLRTLDRSVDITRARILLGFTPRPFEPAMRETIDWFLARGAL